MSAPQGVKRLNFYQKIAEISVLCHFGPFEDTNINKKTFETGRDTIMSTKKIENFFGVSADPLGGPKNGEFSQFYHILAVLGHFGQFKPEKSP